jgi:transcriptional regulator with XRE-family HTH domain
VIIKTADLLLEHFLAWQSKTGERKTLKEFAELVGMSDKQLNHFFTGRREPGEKIATLFANVFNDHRFYDAVEISRPDPNLRFIERHWGEIPVEIQEQIVKVLSPYVKDQVPVDGDSVTANKTAVE